MGAIRRALLGAVAGGVIGGATSDSNIGTGMFQSVALGAAAGAGVGVASSALTARRLWTSTPRGAGLLSQAKGVATGPVARGVKGAAVMGAKGAWGGLKGAGAVTRFALNHPRTAILAAGAGLGLYALSGTGAGSSGMDAREAATIAQRHGGPSTGFAPGMGAMRQQEARAMFMDSTFGLTQGLHAGRHR